MPLGKQCWGCHRRRVRCDSQQPSCIKCTQRGLLCPGYSPNEPLRWRHRIIRHRATAQTVPTFGSQASVQNDVAPSRVILDALTYYNTVIAPDLAADGSSSSYTIDISKWTEFSMSKRHLTLCLVTLHQAVREYGEVSHNQALFHYHQACAARILSHNITTCGHIGPDPELFEDVCFFFFSQIQASAYGAWRAHLNAAKRLFNLWGIATLVRDAHYGFHLYHLVMADIFGMTMTPASHISEEDVSQQKVYIGLLGQFTLDICGTPFPIPEVVVQAIVSINMCRAATPLHTTHATNESHDVTMLSSEALQLLQNFDPVDWALHLQSHTSSQTTSWTLLATCFQTAATLYLIQTCARDFGSSGEFSSENISAAAYDELSKSTHELLSLREHGGVLYKYILWSMVILGIESVSRRNERQVVFLCESLEQSTKDLGTLSMREASIFLNGLWESSAIQEAGPSKESFMNWDVIFERGPLFLI